jgi:hypothetical protein
MQCFTNPLGLPATGASAARGATRPQRQRPSRAHGRTTVLFVYPVDRRLFAAVVFPTVTRQRQRYWRTACLACSTPSGTCSELPAGSDGGRSADQRCAVGRDISVEQPLEGRVDARIGAAAGERAVIGAHLWRLVELLERQWIMKRLGDIHRC